MMPCYLKPSRHTDRCAFDNGHEPAAKHCFWGTGCANLCRRHVEAVRRAYRRGTHRVFEVSELKGQIALPYPASRTIRQSKEVQ